MTPDVECRETVPDTVAASSRQDIIDKEAKRRCLAAGMPLDYLACQDRTFRHDDRRPWWKARFGVRIEDEIKLLEAAGLKVEVA